MKSNIVESVFIPKQWTGITGVEPLKLVFADTLPKILRPKARSVNPFMLINAKKEFDRLCQYFYKPSTSPIASCLVIALKAGCSFAEQREQSSQQTDVEVQQG